MQIRSLLIILLGVCQLIAAGELFADNAVIKNEDGSKKVICSGEFGGLTHALYDLTEALNGDSDLAGLGDIAAAAGLSAERWAAHPEEMDGWAYEAKLIIGKGSSAIKRAGVVELEGIIAHHLLRAMWLFAMDNPDSVEVERSDTYGEIELKHFSGTISCSKKSEPMADSHLVQKVARCRLAP